MEKPVSIEMDDGSLVLLSRTLVVEADPQGMIVRSTESTDYDFEPVEISGSLITQGVGKGTFTINLKNINSIQFAGLLPARRAATAVTPTPTQVKPRYTIIDRQGVSHKVEELETYWSAGGFWIGGRPTTQRVELVIEIRKVLGAGTVAETLTIPFSSMRRIVFEGAPIPQSIQALYRGGERMMSIEMNDGSHVFLSKDQLIEANAQYRVTRSLALEDYSFDRLYYFRGKARTQAGRKESLEIDRSFVRSIEFERP